MAEQEVQPEKSSLSTLSRSSVVPSTAYIHDDFDPPVMPLAQAQRLGLTKRIERPAPVVASHLLFDVTKTQVSASLLTKPRPRLPRRSHDATSFIPSASSASVSSQQSSSGVKLSPLVKQQQQQQQQQQRSQTPDPSMAAMSGHRPRELSMSTSDLPARPRTSVDDFKELQAADDVLERKRRAKHAVKSRHRPTEHAAMDMNMTSDQFGTRPGTSIHGDATQQYHRECFQHDGTSIPARHRMLPHVMVEPSHQKAMTTLSVLRKHQFITRSPAHTRAMTISQRGYVEMHKHGLTQFHSLEDLSEDLTSFTLMTRLAIIKNFREYKVFRNWELCVRHRKFKERCLRLERIMLMQNRSAWACAMDVNKECHALMSEVKEQEIHPPSQGLSVDMLVKELQRRKEILIVSLDMARKRIMYIMDTYFAAVSGEMNVERLREVFKKNRDYDADAAEKHAAKDMVALCRLFVFCEHLVNQAAINLVNQEVSRIARLFDNTNLGSIQAETFMKLDDNTDVPLVFPFSPEVEQKIARAVQVILIPDGATIIDSVKKEVRDICHSISYVMKQRLVPKLDVYVAPSVLELYIGRKPDYLHCVFNSRDFVLCAEHLAKVVAMSEGQALSTLSVGLDPYRPIFGFIEAHSAKEAIAPATDEHGRSVFEQYHEQAEQYSKWHQMLAKLAVGEQELGLFRVRGRRIKTYIIDKLQNIVDSQFDAYYAQVVSSITNIRLEGSRYSKKLDMPITDFASLVDVLPFILDLKNKLDEYEEAMHTAVKMRETLFFHYGLTTKGFDPDGQKLTLPTFNPHLCDQLRQQHKTAMMRMRNQRDGHIELVKTSAETFFKQVKKLDTLLKSSAVHTISDDGSKVLQILEDALKTHTELTATAEGYRDVLHRLRMQGLNLSLLDGAGKALETLRNIWSTVDDFKNFLEFVMQTPIQDLRSSPRLQGTVGRLMDDLQNLLSLYVDTQVLQDFKAEFEELYHVWPYIEKVVDPRINKAHFELLMKDDDSEHSTYLDLSRLTVGMCMERGLLKASSDLAKIHSLAVQEDRAFGILETLKKSMKQMGFKLMRTSATLWLDGVVECASQVQDNSLVTEYVKNSPFADLTGRDMLEIGQVNEEHQFLVAKISFCDDRWKRLRVFSKGPDGKDLVERTLLIAIETAEAKWLSCIDAISHGNKDKVYLDQMDYQDNLRLRECVEHYEKVEQHFPQLAKILQKHLPVLLFVEEQDALLLCSYFAAPSPDIHPHILAICFSNVHSVSFSPDHFKPVSVSGSHQEDLGLLPWSTTDISIFETIRGMPSAVAASVNAAILSCFESAPRATEGTVAAEQAGDGGTPDGSEANAMPTSSSSSGLSGQPSALSVKMKNWSAKHTSQAVCVALQILWTSFLNQAIKTSPRSAYDQTCDHISVYSQALALVLREGDISSLERLKLSALLMHAQSWLYSLSGGDMWGWDSIEGVEEKGKPLIPGGGITPLGIFTYRMQADALVVRGGPYTFEYGNEFLDCTNVMTTTVDSAKYNLHVLMCMASANVGLVAGGGGAQGTGNIVGVGKALGQRVRVFECAGQSLESALTFLTGCEKTGGWLTFKGAFEALGHDQLSELAMAMCSVMETARQSAAAVGVLGSKHAASKGSGLNPYERTGMFLWAPSRQVFEAAKLPPHLREANRPCHMLGTDRLAICCTMLAAAGFSTSGMGGSRLEHALSVLELAVAPDEEWVTSTRGVSAVVREAATLRAREMRGGKSVGTYRPPGAALEEAQGGGDGSQGEAGEEASGAEGGLVGSGPSGDGSITPDKEMSRPGTGQGVGKALGDGVVEVESMDDNYCVAAAFVNVMRRALSDVSFQHSLLAGRLAWDGGLAIGGVPLSIDSLLPPKNHEFEAKVAGYLSTIKMPPPSVDFLSRCTALYQHVRSGSPRGPVILAGAPQSGKSTCIKVVMRAPSMDLDDPFKDPMEAAATQFVSPLGLFAIDEADGYGESFGPSSIQAVRDYAGYYCSSRLSPDFVFADRWLVLDCSSVVEYDCWLLEAHRRPVEKSSSYRRPRVVMETCSLDHAPPSLLSDSCIVSFGPACVGWRPLIAAWLAGRGAALETRSVKEIEVLCDKHLSDIDAFVDRECRSVSTHTQASLARAFLSIFDYHFFLGSDKPSRRTISFTRAAFVYSVAWSWGMLLSPEGRRSFDVWFQDRMRKGGVYRFSEHRSGAKNKTVWDYFVSFEVMDLVLVHETAEAFSNQIKVQVSQGMQCAILPVPEMKAASVALGAHQTTGTHALIVGDPGQGRTLFLEWMRFKSRISDQVHPTHLQLRRSTTSGTIRSFLIGASNAVPDEKKLEWGKTNVHVLVDDLHLPLEAQEHQMGRMGPVAELMRHVMAHKGVASKGKNGEWRVEDDKSLANLVVSSSVQTSWLVSRTARTHLPTHSHRRLLAGMALVFFGPTSHESIKTILAEVSLTSPKLALGVKQVTERLHVTLHTIHDWVTQNVAPSGPDDSMLMWDMEHLRMVTNSILWLPLGRMKNPEECIRFVWHELMRVYSDRIMGIKQIENLRSNVRTLFSKTIGLVHIRRVRQASEAQIFHCLLPSASVSAHVQVPTTPHSALATSRASRKDSSVQHRHTTHHSMAMSSTLSSATRAGWDIVELSPADLVARARTCAHEMGPGWESVLSMGGFPRHLSHALHMLRPMHRGHGSIVVGPRGSGRGHVLRCAAAMCAYDVVNLDDLGLTGREAATYVLNVVDESKEDRPSPVLLLMSSSGEAMAGWEMMDLMLELFKCEGAGEKSAGSHLRFGIMVDSDSFDMQCGQGGQLSEVLRNVGRFCTVDVYEGCSDVSLAKGIDMTGRSAALKNAPGWSDEPSRTSRFLGDSPTGAGMVKNTTLAERADAPMVIDHAMRGTAVVDVTASPPRETGSATASFDASVSIVESPATATDAAGKVEEEESGAGAVEGILGERLGEGLWDNRYSEAMFRVHRSMEQVCPSFLTPLGSGEGGDDFFPSPNLGLRMARWFAESCPGRSQGIIDVRDKMRRACEVYDGIKAHAETLDRSRQILVAKIAESVNTQMKWRDDTIHYASIAARARRMAEDDEIVGVTAVLYGDAPGSDILAEYRESLRHFESACAAVAKLQQVHWMQLEMTHEHPHLQKLLWEAVVVCLGLDSNETAAKNLKDEATEIPAVIAKADIQKVEISTITKLRTFISNPLFIPEKLFQINRAAGTLCSWVRNFERCARAIEWLRPDSVSNKKQSLDRVRQTSKAQLFALRQIEQGLEGDKAKHAEAQAQEKKARAEMEALERQIKECRGILGGLIAEYTSWKSLVILYDSLLKSQTGDSITCAAYIVYVSAIPYGLRSKALAALRLAVEGDVGVEGGLPLSPDFSLASHLECSRAVRTWEGAGLSPDSCSHDNALITMLSSVSGWVPLLVDPLGHAVTWITGLFGQQLVRMADGEKQGRGMDFASTNASRSTARRFRLLGGSTLPNEPQHSQQGRRADVETIIDVLERAQRLDVPVLIEGAEVLVDIVARALHSRKDLIPKASPPPFGDQGILHCARPTYRIFLTTCSSPYLPPASTIPGEQSPIAVVNWDPTPEVIEHVVTEAIVEAADVDAFDARRAYTESSVECKSKIRELQANALEVICSEDVLSQVQGGSGHSFAALCARLCDAKEADQAHIVGATDRLRGVDSYAGLADVGRRVLSALIKVSRMSHREGISLHALKGVVERACRHKKLDFHDFGTASFNQEIEAAAVETVRGGVAMALASLPSHSHDIARLFIGACVAHPELALAAEELVETASNMRGVGGGHGPGGLWTEEGYRGITRGNSRLEGHFEHLRFHMDQEMGEWAEFASNPTVDSSVAIPYSPGNALSLAQRLMIAICVQPAKIQSVISILAREAQGENGQVTLDERVESVLGMSPEDAICITSLKNSCPLNVVAQTILHSAVLEGGHTMPTELAANADWRKSNGFAGTSSFKDRLLSGSLSGSARDVAPPSPSGVGNRGLNGSGFMTPREIMTVSAKVDAGTMASEVDRAASQGAWLFVYGVSKRQQVMWQRAAKSVLLSGQASPRFRLIFEVDEAIAESRSTVSHGGIGNECVGINAENSTDVRHLFGACVADCWMRGLGFSPEGADAAVERGVKFFWRAALGACYFHSVVAREQASAVSVAFQGVERVQLSELLECVRFLSTTVPYAEGGWRGALATARSVIIGASYRRVLEACGCGHALLNATMSKGLYGSRSQVEALGIFIDSPDPVIPGAKDKSSAWAPLFAYARCLDPSIPPAFSPPFAISLDNKYAEANTALDILTGKKKGQGKNFSRGGGEATWRRATSLARSLSTKLPGALDLSLGTLSFYGEKGDEERAKGEWTSQVLIDTLLSSVVSSEIDKANETVKVVGESLALLNRELDGSRYVSSGSRLLFEDIVNDRVPLDWDGNARLRGDSLVRWLGDLRDRTNYLMTKCNDEKLGASRRLKGTTLLVPLRSLMRPKRYLSAFLLALAIHQPSVSLRDIYFCVQPLPLKDVRQPSPEFGIFVSGIIFRSGVLDPATGLLTEPDQGAPSLSPPVNVWLKPLPYSELPGRGQMKAFREHWCLMSLYSQIPSTSDDVDCSQALCKLYCRAIFHPSTVHHRGLCAVLRDT